MPTISTLVDNVKISECVPDLTINFLFSSVSLSKVWDKHTFTLKTSLRGHTGSILALELAEEKGWLFSASGT